MYVFRSTATVIVLLGLVWPPAINIPAVNASPALPRGQMTRPDCVLCVYYIGNTEISFDFAFDYFYENGEKLPTQARIYRDGTRIRTFSPGRYDFSDGKLAKDKEYGYQYGVFYIPSGEKDWQPWYGQDVGTVSTGHVWGYIRRSKIWSGGAWAVYGVDVLPGASLAIDAATVKLQGNLAAESGSSLKIMAGSVVEGPAPILVTDPSAQVWVENSTLRDLVINPDGFAATSGLIAIKNSVLSGKTQVTGDVFLLEGNQGDCPTAADYLYRVIYQHPSGRAGAIRWFGNTWPHCGLSLALQPNDPPLPSLLIQQNTIRQLRMINPITQAASSYSSVNNNQFAGDKVSPGGISTGWTGSLVIDHNLITGVAPGGGIRAVGSSTNVTITYNTVQTGTIELDYTFHGLVQGNPIACNLPETVGIKAPSSDLSAPNHILGNQIANCDIGIDLGNASNPTVQANTIISVEHQGVIFSGAGGFIEDNTVQCNGSTGNLSDGGIVLSGVSGSRVSGNHVNNCEHGIACNAMASEKCRNNLIRNNTIVSSTVNNIRLSGASSNTIYNNFFQLGPGTAQNVMVFDIDSNAWNVTKQPGPNIAGGPYLGGNYWSEYAGPDADKDKLGDTPYAIDAFTGEADKHPLIYRPAVVNSTGDAPDKDTSDGVCDTGGTVATGAQECTLRAAIQQANADTGQDTINFDIPGASGTPVIIPGSTLTSINEATIIDASTQPGSRRVELNGKSAGANTAGLTFSAGGCVVKGLAVKGFKGDGIRVTGTADIALYEVEISDNAMTGLMTSGAVYLKNVQLLNNGAGGSGDGIWGAKTLTIEGTNNRINGNNGIGVYAGSTNISTVEVTGNCGWGIFANGALLIRDSATVKDNNKARTGCTPANPQKTSGIRAAGIDARNLQVTGSNGDGIFTTGGSVRLDTARISDSTLTGLMASGAVYLKNVQLLNNGTGGSGDGIWGARTLTIEGTNNRINGNNGIGVYAGPTDISTVEVTGNCGWGIFANGALLIRDSATVKDNNKARTGCTPMNPQKTSGIRAAGIDARNLQVTGSNGDGIFTTGGPVRLDTARISDSTLTGLMASGAVYLKNIQLLNNGTGGSGDGIWGARTLTIEGANNRVNGNNGIGVFAGPTNISTVEATGNCGWGIFANGALLIRDSATVKDNNKARTGCTPMNPQKTSGIRAAEVNLRNIVVTGNNGYGIDIKQGGTITGGTVCSNSLGGITAGGHVAFMHLDLCMNQGSGLELAPVTGEPPLAAEVTRADRSSFLTGCRVTANTNDGIRYGGGPGLVISNTSLSANGIFGVNNLVVTTPLEALDNWWGDPAGPDGPQGDGVSAGVTYTPWLTAPVSLVVSPAQDPLYIPRATDWWAAIHASNWFLITDSITIALNDQLGWLVGPSYFTLTLGSTDGNAWLDFYAPVSATFGAPDMVTVTAASHANPAPVITNTFQVILTPMADLSLEGVGAPDPVGVDQLLVETLVVHNNGPDPATDVVITDTLPVTATLVSATATQGTCSGTAAIICTLGNITATASATVTLVLTSPLEGDMLNIANVTAREYDPDEWNNTDVSLIRTSWIADLLLDINDQADPVTIGQTLAYTVIITNAGPNPATAVVLTDTLPRNVTLVSVSATQGTCSGTETIVCGLGRLNSGSAAAVKLSVIPQAAGWLENTTEVTAAEYDPDSPYNAVWKYTHVAFRAVSMPIVVR